MTSRPFLFFFTFHYFSKLSVEPRKQPWQTRTFCNLNPNPNPPNPRQTRTSAGTSSSTPWIRRLGIGTSLRRFQSSWSWGPPISKIHRCFTLAIHGFMDSTLAMSCVVCPVVGPATGTWGDRSESRRLPTPVLSVLPVPVLCEPVSADTVSAFFNFKVNTLDPTDDRNAQKIVSA